MVGEYSYAYALATPIFMLFNLRLRFVQISDSNNENKFIDYLSFRLLSTMAALFALVVLSQFLDISVEVYVVVLVIGIAKSFEAISDICYGVFYKIEQMQFIAFSQIIKGSLSLVAFIVLLYKFKNILIPCIGMAIIWGVVCIFIDCKETLRRANKDSNHNILDLSLFLNYEKLLYKLLGFREIAIKAFPLGIMGFLVSLSVNIPRYVIEDEIGARALGFYSAITYIMLGAVMVMSGVLQSAIPRLASFAHDNDIVKFKATLIRLLVISFVVGVFGYVVANIFGKNLLLILYGEEYAEFAIHLEFVMLATILNYLALCFWYALTALKSYWSQFYLYVADISIVYFVSVWLVPEYGIMGAIYAILTVMTFHFIFGGITVGFILSRRLGN